MYKQKGLAPILIVLILAAAVGGYLLYSGKINLNQTTTQVAQPTSTPDVSPAPTADAETANWKTFKNTKLGYEIKYPSDWSIRDEDGSGMLFMLTKQNKSGFIELQGELVFDLQPSQSVENWLKNTPGFGGEYKMVNINGEIAYLGEEGKSIEGSTQIYIKHKDKYLSIALSEFKFAEVEGILSTFKFTE